MLVAACAPALDWRELVAAGTPVRVMLPCKPSVFARPVAMAGQSVQWTLLSCRAEGATWSLGFAELADPATLGRVSRSLAATEMGAERLGWTGSGFTPHPDAGRWRWVRVAAEGQALRGETVVAVYARHVFRATVTAQQLDPEAVDFFFASLTVRP